MQPGARLNALIELVQSLLDAWQQGKDFSADIAFKHYTRTRRYIGGGDRRALAADYYDLLRHYGILQEQGGTTGRLLALLNLQRKGLSLESIAALCSGAIYHPAPLQPEELIQLRQALSHTPSSPAACNLPEWLYQTLAAEYGDEKHALCAALQQPAPLDLRVNLQRTTREAVLAELKQHGLVAEIVDGLPAALTLPASSAVTTLPVYLEGRIEIQDRGSQAACYAVSDLSPSLVIDYCAGGGGKSLALAAQYGPAVRMIATDANASRLADIAPRAARAGITHLRVETLDEPFHQRYQSQADLLVLDVPCSGTGTLRRHPDLAWRLSDTKISQYLTQQLTIFNRAVPLVKIGGKLLYITCSLLMAENQKQMDFFLQLNANFRVVAPQKIWMMGATNKNAFLQFTPHRHHSDGFFVALLERVA